MATPFRSAVTVSLVPEAKGGPFVFSTGLADGCAAAARLGFDAVEIFPPEAAEIDPVELKGLLDQYGLKVAAIGTGGGWVRHKLRLTDPDESIRRKAREFIRGIIDRAAEFHAPAILGSMQGRWEGEVGRDLAVEWLGDALNELGAHAERRGTPLLFEPLNRYEGNLFNRLGDTTAWLRTLKTRNVRVLADLFHLSIEEADLPAALREAGAMVGHVHFADSNRQAFGFGHTNLVPIVAALRAIGYSGYLSAEILPLPDAVSAATQTMKAIRSVTEATEGHKDH